MLARQPDGASTCTSVFPRSKALALDKSDHSYKDDRCSSIAWQGMQGDKDIPDKELNHLLWNYNMSQQDDRSCCFCSRRYVLCACTCLLVFFTYVKIQLPLPILVLLQSNLGRDATKRSIGVTNRIALGGF
mmetsp:Transcript_21343/g.27577  ORF Transcript_21343/g.27577 Transcript_21343/m.27577 type:complete len:131 (-) Transcript_21343:312-704(-)